ncbi:hypothetical protein Cgig2_011287 [Carnegiea gigantea]|uniref:Uncharacterized protein n=1 Tax=Carnegiea gigantea TaxID=171969 RepID=A0A9Q1GT04_9CARY|nr:hypothetical protein Cgig2_011287 [Carnegiea gigantea]
MAAYVFASPSLAIGYLYWWWWLYCWPLISAFSFAVKYYGKEKPCGEQLPVKTDQDALREGYRFIRTEEDDMDASWEQRLVKRYYDKLFKEYPCLYKKCLILHSRYVKIQEWQVYSLQGIRAVFACLKSLVFDEGICSPVIRQPGVWDMPSIYWLEVENRGGSHFWKRHNFGGGRRKIRKTRSLNSIPGILTDDVLSALCVASNCYQALRIQSTSLILRQEKTSKHLSNWLPVKGAKILATVTLRCAEKLHYRRNRQKEQLESKEEDEHKRKREVRRGNYETDDEYKNTNYDVRHKSKIAERGEKGHSKMRR